MKVCRLKVWKAFHHTGLQNTWKNKDVCVYRKYPKLSGCSQRPDDDHSWWVPWCCCTTRYVKHPSWLKDFVHPRLHIAVVINSVIRWRRKCHVDKAIKVRWKENRFQHYFCSAVGKHNSLYPSINCSQHQMHISEQLLQVVIVQFWNTTQPHTASEFLQLSHQPDHDINQLLKV